MLVEMNPYVTPYLYSNFKLTKQLLVPPNLITSPCKAVIKIPIWQVRNWGSENQSYSRRLPYRGQIASAKDDEGKMRRERRKLSSAHSSEWEAGRAVVCFSSVWWHWAWQRPPPRCSANQCWPAVMTPQSLSLQIQCRPRARYGMSPKGWVLVYKIVVLII